MSWSLFVLLLAIAILILAIAITIAARRGRVEPAEPAALIEVAGAATPVEPVASRETVAPLDAVTPAPRSPYPPYPPYPPYTPYPPYPIVLVHGFLGFGEIQIFGRRYQYFRGVAEAIAETGAPVHIVTLPPMASIEARARVLAEAVCALPAPRVHLVAQSMGGLDARYAITKLGVAGRVASLVTIGTPHHGTPLARLGNLPLVPSLRRAFVRAGFDDQASEGLTPERMARFNEEIQDHPDVYYASVVASARWRSTNPALWTGHVFLGLRAGTSEGVVPLASQYWGEVLDQLDADHWAQIGWSFSFDARQLYRGIARRLHAREPALIIVPGTSTADTDTAELVNAREATGGGGRRREATGGDGRRSSPRANAPAGTAPARAARQPRRA